MEPKDGFVEANGIRLHYLEWGAGAPPVVLLHATGFLARLWEPIAVQMSTRFHVYALDARGHGDSDKPVLSGAEGPAPAGGYGWEGLAADLMGFLDAVGLVGVPIVGHSSGAAGAIRLAARRAAPDAPLEWPMMGTPARPSVSRKPRRSAASPSQP